LIIQAATKNQEVCVFS